MILSEILSYNHAGGIWFRIIPKHFLQRTNLRIFPRYPTSVQQSREQIEPFRSRDNLSKHPREQNKPFRSRDNLSKHPPVSRTSLSCSRDNLGKHPREHLELSLRTGKAGWSAFFGTRPHIGRKNGHRTAELFLL